MLRITVTKLAFAAACLTALAAAPVNAQSTSGQSMRAPTEVITNGPQTDVGDLQGRPAAQQNVRESSQYDQAVGSSPGFREQRMTKECGPITDAKLHADCVASFGSTGSSQPPK